jgi:3-(3-hydroxy-phenyl)propionate hydroxylase
VKILLLEDVELAPFRLPLSAWLNKHDAEAVLVRPDRYVFGSGVAETLVAAWQAHTKSM